MKLSHFSNGSKWSCLDSQQRVAVHLVRRGKQSRALQTRVYTEEGAPRRPRVQLWRSPFADDAEDEAKDIAFIRKTLRIGLQALIRDEVVDAHNGHADQYKTFIRSITKATRFRDAVMALQTLKAAVTTGVEVDAYMIAAVLNVLFLCDKPRLAEVLYKEFFSKDKPGCMSPNETVLEVMTYGYGQMVPPYWDGIIHLEKQWRNEFDNEPNGPMYDAMLHVCSRTNDVQRGAILIDRMWTLGVNATDGTWNACRKKKVFRARLQKIYGKVYGGHDNKHPWGPDGVPPRPIVDPDAVIYY